MAFVPDGNRLLRCDDRLFVHGYRSRNVVLCGKQRILLGIILGLDDHMPYFTLYFGTLFQFLSCQSVLDVFFYGDVFGIRFLCSLHNNPCQIRVLRVWFSLLFAGMEISFRSSFCRSNCWIPQNSWHSLQHCDSEHLLAHLSYHLASRDWPEQNVCRFHNYGIRCARCLVESLVRIVYCFVCGQSVTTSCGRSITFGCIGAATYRTAAREAASEFLDIRKRYL